MDPWDKAILSAKKKKSDVVQVSHRVLGGGRYLVSIVDGHGNMVRGVMGVMPTPGDKKAIAKLKLNEKQTSRVYWVITRTVDKLAMELPGMDRKVKHPVTGDKGRLFDVIMNLNDACQWSREKIADWIETLDDVPTFGAK